MQENSGSIHMNDLPQWSKVDDEYRHGDARAEQFDDPPAFVIQTFGPGADADTAFACILSAMPFGLIAINGAEENRTLARELVDQDRVQFSPFVGLPFDAIGVVAVKPGDASRSANPLHRGIHVVLEFVRRLLGNKVADEIGQPTGKTGNHWNEDDFSGHDTPLAVDGGPEFVAFCVQQGTCELDGEVLEKFKEIIKKYRIQEDESDDDYDAQNHFAVVVRQGLIEESLLPAGDPDRYQYKISMGFIHYAE
jgi:hypothetical protein